MRIVILLIGFCLVFWVSLGAQIPSPGVAPEGRVLLLGGVAHIGNGEVIQNSAIAIKNGYFEFVKNQMIYRIDQAEFDTVIHLNGQHIFPGFIACNSTLGLREIDAVRATLDYDDVGLYNPNVRSAIAFNTESRILPTVRSNGVLLGQITPRGGIISGSSSVMHFDGWNWEDALIKADEGIHLNWPRRFKRSGWWANPGETKRNKKADERIQAIYSFFRDAQSYAQQKAPEINLRMEAMKGLFDGTKTLYIHCNQAREIIQAVELKRAFNLEHLVIVGGYDAWLVPEVLTDNDVPVLLSRLHSLPLRPEDPVDLPYRLPALLKEQGIVFAFDMSGDMEAMNTRNLPFTAGTSITYGLAYEEAVQALTQTPAQLLGIDDLYGTIQAGKSATFFVSIGDPFDMRTNNLIVAMVNGKFISLDTPQKALYRKYRKKYRN